MYNTKQEDTHSQKTRQRKEQRREEKQSSVVQRPQDTSLYYSKAVLKKISWKVVEAQGNHSLQEFSKTMKKVWSH